MSRHPNEKINAEDCRAIRRACRDGHTRSAIAERLDVSVAAITYHAHGACLHHDTAVVEVDSDVDASEETLPKRRHGDAETRHGLARKLVEADPSDIGGERA